MSTYYYFACDKCKEYGGWFSRQAWGWGNMDIIDTFAFLANHAEHRDPYQEGVDLRVISEHDTYEMTRQGWTHIVGPSDPQRSSQKPLQAPKTRWRRHGPIAKSWVLGVVALLRRRGRP